MKNLAFIYLYFLFSITNLTAQKALPPDNHYVSVKEGQLFLFDERTRFWGCVGNFPAKTHADNEAVVKRLKNLGFNMVRFWKVPNDSEYIKGDGSYNDLVDHFIWCIKKEEMYIWYAGLNKVGQVTAKDVNVLNDLNSETQWIEAVAGNGQGVSLRNHPARIWDERLHLLGKERMQKIASHYNQWTDFKYADDPVIAVWELSNEEWWFGRTTSKFESIHRYFKSSLLKKWNLFLKNKYGSEEKLRLAWLNLLPGESLQNESIMLLPLKENSKMNVQRVALGVNIEDGEDRNYKIRDFNKQRGADVVEFLVNIWIEHKKKENDALKSWGKSCSLSPLVWDTGIGYEIQSQYLHQQADAVAHSTYLTGFHHDKIHERYPWISRLEEPPSTSWKDPWLEQNRIPGKPFFIYETQIHNPAKYRVEFPMQIASLGSFQDYDIIIWHYFGNVPPANEKKAYNKPMDYSVGGVGHPQGLHFIYDEVQQSAMTTAGYIFRNFLLKPASQPTTFIFGKNTLYDPLGMEDQGSFNEMGKYFVPTTYRYGSRMIIDTSRISDTIIGPVVSKRIYEPNPYQPTNEIIYDWKRGFLKLNSKGAVSYTGFLAKVVGDISFTNGIKLSNVTFNNPDGMAYPVTEDEQFLQFSLVALDKKPLTESSNIYLSLVSTSFNSGFQLNHDGIQREFGWFWKENEKATISTGALPVNVTRVGATISAPYLKNMNYDLIDWHLNVIRTGRIKDDQLILPDDIPIFLVHLYK